MYLAYLFSNSRLFYITDKLTGHRFLIDTGAEVSVIPPSQSDRLHKQDLVLQAANNTSITTYGRRSLTLLNLGLGREFQWIFIVADVKRPILGIDFLRHYALIVDVRRQQLLDAPTQSKVKVTTSSEPSINITLLPRTPANSYEVILHGFSISDTALYRTASSPTQRYASYLYHWSSCVLPCQTTGS